MVRSRELAQMVRPYLAKGFTGLGQVLLFPMVLAQAVNQVNTDKTADPVSQQAVNAFSNLTNAICAVVNALKGPFGLAVVVIMFSIGAISLMVGGRRAVPIMIAAAVGGVILASAPAFARIFMSGVEGGCGG